jgi:hypothetical protein
MLKNINGYFLTDYKHISNYDDAYKLHGYIYISKKVIS